MFFSGGFECFVAVLCGGGAVVGGVGGVVLVKCSRTAAWRVAAAAYQQL